MLKKLESYDRTGRPVVCNSSNTRQLGGVFQEKEPPKSSSILRTKAVARHADIRDQNPSLGLICPGEHHQRSPNAPKFEDRSLEETEWLAKSVLSPTTTSSQRLMSNTPRSPRASNGTLMTSTTMTSPSARRSLTRADDEPITLKKKACRPVCRRQSVMIDR